MPWHVSEDCQRDNLARLPPPHLTPPLPNSQLPTPQVNASDARGKSDASALKGVGGKLSNAIKEMSTNTAVSYDKKGQRKKVGEVWG